MSAWTQKSPKHWVRADRGGQVCLNGDGARPWRASTRTGQKLSWDMLVGENSCHVLAYATAEAAMKAVDAYLAHVARWPPAGFRYMA